MFRRIAPVLLAALTVSCVAADPASESDPDSADVKESGVVDVSGLTLMGIHDPPFGPELLDLFPNGGGFVLRTLYSTDFDWIGNVPSETTWAKQHNFKPIVRVDYARPDGSTFANGQATPGATVPPPGDVGWCLARSGGPSRDAGGKHLDCYLKFLSDLVPSTPDVHHWIVGNEMNMVLEAKAHPNGKIDPAWYAQVYRAARQKIHSYPGHEQDAVFVGAVAPGAAGPATYKSGKQFLSEMLYSLQPDEVDAIAMHAYGGWGKACDNGGATPISLFEQGSGGDALGYRNQAQWIDALGYSRTPLLITEMSANLHVGHGAPNPLCGKIDDGYLYDRADVANFIRDAYGSINAWNGGPENHDIVGGIWFIYDSPGFGSESLKNMRDLVKAAGYGTSTTENPYYAFRDLVKNATYGAGSPQGYGKCWESTSGAPQNPDKAPYALVGKIRDAWNSNGGLAVFGYPIQDAACRADDHGRVLFSQYTQRARLEYHPELAGTSYEISYGLLGRPVAAQNGVNPDAWSNSNAPHGGDCQFIGANSSTGHYVCGKLLQHWKSHGVSDPGLDAYNRSLRLWGLPISEPVQYKGRTVQWFERARLEIHDENAPPYDVLGGLLGCEASGISGWGC